MGYQHRVSPELEGKLGSAILSNASKVICVGRNYAAHADELDNPIPEAPIFFIKPNSALVNWGEQVEIPINQGECHHELELALLISQPLTRATYQQACDAVAGVSLGLDLTLRDLQSKLKAKGHPWELAKAFDASCPVARWQPLSDISMLDHMELALAVNGQDRQASSTRLMLWSAVKLIELASQHFSLCPGDVLMTGTPAGVGKLDVGDSLEARLNQQQIARSQVVAQSICFI